MKLTNNIFPNLSDVSLFLIATVKYVYLELHTIVVMVVANEFDEEFLTSLSTILYNIIFVTTM